jgi:competence protein ComEC
VRETSGWIATIEGVLEAQRPRAMLWMPVLYGSGIAAYFSAPIEPPLWMLAALGGAAGVLCGTFALAGPRLRMAILVLLVPILGFGGGSVRTLLVGAPVLEREMTVAVEGRLIGLSRSASERTRVLLDRVVIHGVEPEATPERVRISVDETTPPDALVPGTRLVGQARLSPPGGPGQPGGFDFRRHAWFERLGAVGYTNTPMLEMEGGDGAGFHQLTFRARMAMSAHIQGVIGGQNGAFAAAILTGDRSGISVEVEEALRLSTLYHIISIGGLHMSLIAAATYGLVRYGLCLVPVLALTWPLKKIAAVVALGVTAAYLAISGFDVAAQRAFLMSGVVLTAVLVDRPALTMNSVALSALVVLALAPESLTEAGFQMSFAGTIALIAVFDALRRQGWWEATQTERKWRFVKPVLAAFMTSLVAGLATAPFSAFHFNVLGQYGLLANMLAMPAMGVVVMPAAVGALFLAPFGLDWLALIPMGWGIGYVIAVADFVAALDGAAVGVPAGPGISLALLAFGALFVLLWVGRLRWAGLAAVALAAGTWGAHPRPDLLISEDGRLFGYRTPEGRAVSNDKGSAYAAEGWLEDDGDVATQAEAFARGAFRRSRARVEAEVPGIGRVVYVGWKDPESGVRECAGAAVLLAPQWDQRPEGPCRFVGREELAAEGALAVWIGAEGPDFRGALTESRGRAWSP